MTNKTISELPNFTGDTSMRLHVHKPGSSQSLSLNDIGNLVTTGEGLQTGDVVLRPAGSYSDALECNGATYLTSDAPFLASKLSPFSGAIPTSVNANSEIRVGADVYHYVYKAGDLILAATSTLQDLYINNVRAARRSVYSDTYGNGRIYKIENRVYITNRDSSGTSAISKLSRVNEAGFFDAASMPSNTSAILGVVSLDAEYDLVFASHWVNSANMIGYKVSKNQNVAAEIIDYGAFGHYVNNSYIFQYQQNVMFFGVINNVSGLFKLSVGTDAISVENVSVFSMSSFTPRYNGGDTLIYADPQNKLKKLKVSDGTITDLNVDVTSYSPSFIYNDTVVTIRRSSLPYLVSFDGGQTWNEGPTMSAYVASDYGSGELVFVGGSGNTGSVNNQSGTLQINAVNFSSDVMFKVPLVSSYVNNFKQYIIK